jgi:triacylglycerol lipase
MSVVGGCALLCALAIGGVNAALYLYRAAMLKNATGCEAVEPLGVVTAAWAFTKECTALAAVLLLVPAGWCRPRCRSGAGTRGAVILVPGWGANRGCFWLLRRRLLRDGWSPVCCADYRPWSANVERAAEELRRVAEGISLRAQGQPITLIGHGLGGLVVRYFLRRYPAPRMRRVITLGTPHLGSTPATRRVGAAARRIAPGSPLVKTLNAADHIPQQFDVIAIHSTFDALVLPPGNAEYPGAFNVQVNDVGHNALLLSGKVYRLLAENLSAPLR